MAGQPYTDADVELVAGTLDRLLVPDDAQPWPSEEVPGYVAEIRRWSRAVLDDLTRAGWHRPGAEIHDDLAAAAFHLGYERAKNDGDQGRDRAKGRP